MMRGQVIDIDSLLNPISDDMPSGRDPRSDASPNPLYYQIKDARNAARSAERASVEVCAPPVEWRAVSEIAINILQHNAKDLEIAAWLTEALLRLEGFSGLRDGLKVILGITRYFWESCFPELDEEEGIAGKVSAVAGLNGSGAMGTLIQPIRLAELTHGSQASFSFWNYEQAIEIEKINDYGRKQEKIDNGSISMEQFLRSVSETPTSKFIETLTTIEETLAVLNEMSIAFEAVAGIDAPSILALKEILEGIIRAIRHFAANKLAATGQLDCKSNEMEERALQDAGGIGNDVNAAHSLYVRGFSSREEALQQLTRIADYFRQTEPYSFIPYTLEEAVRRARLGFPELLLDLAEDPAHIERILIAAGIKIS